MRKERLEAFSDGILAIIITVMVLELKVPHGETLAALDPVLDVFLSYVLSFVNIGIYWNNHHHMFTAAKKVDGSVMWANLHLMFWLSLIPFTTAWMGETGFASTPTAVYGFDLLMAGVAYSILLGRILRLEGNDSVLAKAIGNDVKGKASLLLYLIAIPLSFVSRWIAGALYVTVLLTWVIPDRRIERVVVE